LANPDNVARAAADAKRSLVDNMIKNTASPNLDKYRDKKDTEERPVAADLRDARESLYHTTHAKPTQKLARTSDPRAHQWIFSASQGVDHCKPSCHDTVGKPRPITSDTA
jgi:hypothetical protein